MLLATLFLLPLALGAPDASRGVLATLAAASPRPAVCRVASGADGSSLWARARKERTSRFCLALARGYAKLESDPQHALGLARDASKMLLAQVEPKVLEGRALLRLGESAAARSALAASVLAPGRPLGDLGSLRELGIASTLTGHTKEAADAYRVLLPRVDVISDRFTARILLLEGAAALLATGPNGTAEALVYLSEARRAEPVPGYQDLTLALLALALDRDGKTEQATAVLGELAGAWTLRRFLSERELASATGAPLIPEAKAAERPALERAPVFADGDLHAVIALAALRTDPRLAGDHVAAFEQSPAGKGPWAAWAAARFGALRRGRRP